MILLLMLASVAAPGSGELFTSMAHLQRALHTEKDIAKEIRHYLYEEKEGLQKLEQLADEFERHSAKALKESELYIGNPVNAYLFVKHFTLDWGKDIDVVIKNNSRDELHTKIEKMREHLPTHEDLTGSASSLLRLQDTYKLEATELARGNVSGFASSKLSARDCFELGRLALNSGNYYHATMWMEEALAQVHKIEDDDITAADILENLAFSLYKQGNVKRALSLTNEVLTLTPEHNRCRNNKEYYEKVLREKDGNNSTRGDESEVVNNRPLNEYMIGEEFTAYEALCRNENITANKFQHRLFCRYRTNNHPLLILSPAKEELLYLNPFVSVFHDSISDREITLIQNLSIPKDQKKYYNTDMKLGRLCTAATQHLTPAVDPVIELMNLHLPCLLFDSELRSCWLYDEDSPDIRKINKRIAAMTGLNMDTAEPLQIANYGIGGQNEPHSDYYKMEGNKASEDIKHGNRIATFMFYLTDVQAGGATVFPYLGLKVFPEKGKSIFWYNLHKNGRGFFNTRHAACPVLVGSKWVANKWIHERGQEFIRPCGLQESE